MLKVLLPIIIIAVFAVVLIEKNSLQKLMGNSVTSEYYCEDSTYTLEGTSCTKTIQEKPYLVGDVDLDGRISLEDRVYLAGYLENVEKYNIDNIKVADINNDGEINESDLNILANYLLGDTTTSTVDAGYEDIGIKKVCKDEYTLNGNYCEKEEKIAAIKKTSKISSSKSNYVVSLDITDDQNSKTDLDKNTKVTLDTTFTINDSSKKYYYMLKIYDENENTVSKSSCMEVENSETIYSFNITGDNYGVYSIYTDSSCHLLLNNHRFETKKYTCKNCQVNQEETNQVDITYSDDQNSSTSLKENTVVNITTTFKASDTTKQYYYKWRTYKDGKLHVSNDNYCKKLTDTKKTTLTINGTRKGEMLVYGDASCTNLIKKQETKTYTCSNCKKVTINIKPQDSKTTLPSRIKYKFNISFNVNDTTKQYYYKWYTYSNSKLHYETNGCLKLFKGTKEYTLDINGTRKGKMVVYSDASCKNQVTAKETSEYKLSDIIWPVTPQFQLLSHDKQITRVKHYCYGTSEWHEGLDITVPIGTPVYALAEGKVYATNTFDGGTGSNHDEDYGNVIFITTKINGISYRVAYAHLKDSPTKYVKVGQTVKKGQLIGYSGITGGSRIPHLHIDFYSSSKGYLDPLSVLPSINNFSNLKTTVKRSDYTKNEFPDSSLELYNNMRSMQNSNQTWNYKIYAIAKEKVGSIKKGAKVEVISRVKCRKTGCATNVLKVKYNGKTYSNLDVTKFKFNW